jgi:LmbE family N-acetylglucosaminyl deacetylase
VVVARGGGTFGCVSSGVGAVSPHLDDLALSCAGILAAHSDSSLVTALAGGPAGVDPVTGWESLSGEFRPGDDIVGARRAEDSQASAMFSSECHHLDHWDHQYRNATYGYRGSTDPSELIRAVTVDLATLVDRSVLDTWIIPLGLSHPDHEITAAACLALVDQFPEIDWLVYEELPYAIYQPEVVVGAIADLQAKGFDLRPADIGGIPDRQRKRRVVNCYRSQLKPLGDAIDDAVSAPEQVHRLSRRN